MAFTKKDRAKYLTEGRVKEMVDTALREAFGDHSRELEAHLNDIHRRLQGLEKRGKK
tara:strand:+ start:253 stop:423 length:171 start_codon:yes stop_codon:yes gene_type:complete